MSDDDDIQMKLVATVEAVCKLKLLDASPIFAIARKLTQVLDKLNLKKWLGTAEVNVDVLRTVRPWKDW